MRHEELARELASKQLGEFGVETVDLLDAQRCADPVAGPDAAARGESQAGQVANTVTDAGFLDVGILHLRHACEDHLMSRRRDS
jgi:hypothetical protein